MFLWVKEFIKILSFLVLTRRDWGFDMGLDFLSKQSKSSERISNLKSKSKKWGFSGFFRSFSPILPTFGNASFSTSEYYVEMKETEEEGLPSMSDPFWSLVLHLRSTTAALNVCQACWIYQSINCISGMHHMCYKLVWEMSSFLRFPQNLLARCTTWRPVIYYYYIVLHFLSQHYLHFSGTPRRYDPNNETSFPKGTSCQRKWISV